MWWERCVWFFLYPLLYSFINESWKSHPLFMSWSSDRCSKLICIDDHCVTLLLCGFSESSLKLEGFLTQLQLRPLPPLEPAPKHHQSGQGMECTPHTRTVVVLPLHNACEPYSHQSWYKDEMHPWFEQWSLQIYYHLQSNAIMGDELQSLSTAFVYRWQISYLKTCGFCSSCSAVGRNSTEMELWCQTD